MLRMRKMMSMMKHFHPPFQKLIKELWNFTSLFNIRNHFCLFFFQKKKSLQHQGPLHIFLRMKLSNALSVLIKLISIHNDLKSMGNISNFSKKKKISPTRVAHDFYVKIENNYSKILSSWHWNYGTRGLTIALFVTI